MDINYHKFLKGKRVALVGPSKSIEGSHQGKKINSYDVVVRMNKAIPVPPEFRIDVGGKTDILYNCLEPARHSGGNIDPELWRKHGVKWVASPYPGNLWFTKGNFENFLRKNKNILKVHVFDRAKYDVLEKDLNTRPNTGLLAMIDLLDHGIKELYITGMTFGRDGYHSKYPGNISLEHYKKMANGPHHKQQPQEEYFINLFHKEDRIKVDEPLNKIIKGEW